MNSFFKNLMVKHDLPTPPLPSTTWRMPPARCLRLAANQQRPSVCVCARAPTPRALLTMGMLEGAIARAC